VSVNLKGRLHISGCSPDAFLLFTDSEPWAVTRDGCFSELLF